MKSLPGYKYLLVFRAIIVNDEDKVLLLKRSSQSIYNAAKWEFPGGKLQSGEDINTSVEAIINRETNLIIEPTSRRYYYHSRLVTEGGKYQGFTYVEITGEAKYLGGGVVIGEGHEDSRWVKLEEAFEYDMSMESKKSLTKYYSEIKGALKADGPGKIPVVLSAKALITDSYGRCLFVRRTKAASYPLKWDLPGGKMDSFEVLGELMKREVFEEVGLVINISKPGLFINSQIVNEGKYKGYTYITIVSGAAVTAGRITLSSEHVDFRWVEPEDIFSLDLVDYIRLPLTEIFLKEAEPKKILKKSVKRKRQKTR